MDRIPAVYPGILDCLQDGILAIDRNGLILYANSVMVNNLACPYPSDTVQTIQQVLPKSLLEGIPISTFHPNSATLPSVVKLYCPEWNRYFEIRSQSAIFGMVLQFRDITVDEKVKHAIYDNQKNMHILSQVTSDILSSKKPKEMLDNLFAKLSSYLNLDVYFNYMWDKPSRKLRLMNYHGASEQAAHNIQWLELGEAVCGSVAQSRTKMVVESIQHSDDPKVQVIRQLGIRCYACHPLFSYGEFIGTLSFGSKERENFNSEELFLMECICKQVGQALERTLLNSELAIRNRDLAESEAKFRSIIEGALDGIILVDMNGTISESNPAACKLLRKTSKELFGKSVKSFIRNSQEQAFLEYCRILRTQGQCYGELKIHVNKNSVLTIGFAATKNVIPDYHLIVFRDITNQKKLERSLIRAKRSAEKANEAKSSFLSMMSHELRTPLNSIIGYGQILHDELADDFQLLQVERVEKILDSSRQLLRMINEILGLVRNEASPSSRTESFFSIESIIQECFAQVQPLAEKRNVRLLAPQSVGVAFFVSEDKIRWKQILVNLLSNAVKYNQYNGEVRVEYRLNASRNRVAIAVTDTGAGIPKHEWNNIFKPFYRIVKKGQCIDGTGIGLSLAKQLATDLGGKIKMESEAGKGSTFTLSLPIQPLPPQTKGTSGEHG